MSERLLKISSTSPPGGNLVDGLPPAASFDNSFWLLRFFPSRLDIYLAFYLGFVAILSFFEAVKYKNGSAHEHYMRRKFEYM